MNPYVVSVSGVWPNEGYVYTINPAVIDYRFSQMAVNFICSPFFSEDHNLTEISYYPPKINSLVGLSSNSDFFVTQNNLEFNTNVIPGLTFVWSPSSLRKSNKGSVFGALLLGTDAPNYYGASVYPSRLFLYPLSATVIDNYEIISSSVSAVTAYGLDDSARIQSIILDFYPNILLNGQYEPQVDNFVQTLSPQASTVRYSLSTQYISTFNVLSGVSNFLNDPFTFTWLTSSSTINNGATSINYSLSSPYASSAYFNTQIQINSFYNSILPSLYKAYTLEELGIEILYRTLSYNVTSQNYVMQTSSVLLSSYEFQFSNWDYASEIKPGHEQFISRLPLIETNQNINLDNIMYELSGTITHGRQPVITYYADENPTYFNAVLEPPGYVIRPDTLRLQYFVELKDYAFDPPLIRGMGDQFDDLQYYQNRSIEPSYIIKQNDSTKNITFQLLQSSINPQLPLEDSSNCVLSAILNYETSRFQYFNTATYLYNDGSYGVITPVSGVRNTDLSLRYIAETPYIKDTNENINTTLLSISSYPSLSLNTPVAWTGHNREVIWNLKYPPYYYAFKNSYKAKNFNYENKSTLNFYLTSYVRDTKIENITSVGLDYAIINLYNTIYSDFDIIELPLKQYGWWDYIKFELDDSGNTSLPVNIDYVSAYLVADNGNTIFYDISSSPYVPAVSGSNLRLIYNLSNGGAVFSIRPSISTRMGLMEAYWSTTFPVALDYNIKNYIRPLYVETLQQDLSSITLSVANLSGGENTPLNLAGTYIHWNSTSGLFIENLTTENDINKRFPILTPEYPYLFEDAHTVKITGITNENVVVTLSSQKYNNSAQVIADTDYFDLYFQNNIQITKDYSDLKNKTKKISFLATVPYFSKQLDIPNSAFMSWTWEYDNINESALMSVSAYVDSNFSIPYKYGNIQLAQSIKKIYFLIESDYSLSEIFKSLHLKTEVYDQGKLIPGEIVYPVNSYPDPSFISADFTATYESFPNIPVIDTINNLKSLTRPPNGTNNFRFKPKNLQTNIYNVSSFQWQISGSIISNTSTSLLSTEVITLTTNNIGDYDTHIIKNFNLYERKYKDYYNLEYLNSDPLSKVLSQESLNTILSALSAPILKQNNSYLAYLSSFTNLSPKATSLFVASTSKYISAFDTPNEFSFLGDYNNLYATNYYTSTISIQQSGIIFTYNAYVVDFWLSSVRTTIADDATIISSFSADYIIGNPNLLYFNTSVNLTTSLSYGVSSDVIKGDAYYYNTVSLNLKNVNVPGWENLYDFYQTAQIIITNSAEFTTSPSIQVVPRFIWSPEKNKKANRYLKILNVENNANSYSPFLSGKVYANKKDNLYEYGVRVAGVQDKNISQSDKILFMFAVGDNQLILEDQIIDEFGEYLIATDKPSDIIIKSLKIPYSEGLKNSSGASLAVTAFNVFFPPEGGLTYYGLNSLSSKELQLFYYPITAKTLNRDSLNVLTSDILFASPRLFDYEPCKLLFYPKLKTINLDEGGLLQVKQIIEINPVNSPNIINYDLSTVTYTLCSDFWSTSITIPAISSATINLFNITIGDATAPLQVSDFNVSNLILSASARIASKILSTTFDKTTGYTEDRDLWEIAYENVIGNPENTHKFLNLEISNGITNTQTPTAYYPVKTGNEWVLTI